MPLSAPSYAGGTAVFIGLGHYRERFPMKRNSPGIRSGETVSSLELNRARVSFSLQPRILLGKVSAAFVGQRNGSIRFTFVPRGRKAASGISSLEFELTRNQASFLAEWMTDQSIRKGPEPQGK
jgi:hypothetical protein